MPTHRLLVRFSDVEWELLTAVAEREHRRVIDQVHKYVYEGLVVDPDLPAEASDSREP